MLNDAEIMVNFFEMIFSKRILTSLLITKLILDALILQVVKNKFKVHFILKGARAIIIITHKAEFLNKKEVI